MTRILLCAALIAVSGTVTASAMMSFSLPHLTFPASQQAAGAGGNGPGTAPISRK